MHFTIFLECLRNSFKRALARVCLTLISALHTNLYAFEASRLLFKALYLLFAAFLHSVPRLVSVSLSRLKEFARE